MDKVFQKAMIMNAISFFLLEKKQAIYYKHCHYV